MLALACRTTLSTCSRRVAAGSSSCFAARAVSAVSQMKRSWVEHKEDSNFPLQNLPFGVFACSKRGPRCATAIGDYAVDLSVLAEAGLLSELPFDACGVFHRPRLNAFMSLPRPAWRATRARLEELLSADGDDALRRSSELRAAALRPMSEVTMQMPAEVGDYTDFYSSREHATNVGIMFRGKDNALQPNWLHLPVGYHGRASSVVVSGTPIARPRGQLQADANDESKGSVYGPSRLLDFELEVGLFLGGSPPPLGRPITMEEVEEYMFGVVLMNDWSARDIQRWEYVPLGPFGAKNFGTTISPWIVSLDALEPFRCKTSDGTQDPVPLQYLRDPTYGSYDIKLEVDLQTPAIDGKEGCTTTISRSNFRHLYWSIKQQLVHHSVTGCNMRAGDLLGSGTISGTDPGSYGSMLELTWRGRDEIKLADGGVRKFLADRDTLAFRGYCGGGSQPRIGFGSCSGQILPAGSLDKGSTTPVPMSHAGAAADGLSVASFSKFVLHSYWRSSCSWRVRTALAHYRIPFEFRPVHLLKDGGEQNTQQYLEVNPMAQLPSLSFEDHTGKCHALSQSVAIIDFLDSTFAGKASPLLPSACSVAGALRRAKALQIAEIINSGIQPLQNLSTTKAVDLAATSKDAGREFAAHYIRKGLAACEKLVAAAGGRFAVGDEVSIADICIVPQLYSARRFGVEVDSFPALLKVEANCQKLPSFQAAHADNQPDAA